MQAPDMPGTIKVFGSAQIAAPPDHAIVDFVVSRSEPNPESAFAAANAAASTVRAFLRNRGEDDVRSSRINLNQREVWGDQQADGQRERKTQFVAEIGHRVLTADLDGLESLLTGLIDAGVNQLRRVSFETSHLKDLRSRARQHAVVAAREKADLYAGAAGVSIGSVIAIEDANPDLALHPRGARESNTSTDATSGSTDPGMIDVTGRVFVWYAID